jgi:ABC-2 type transport system permease protein
MNRPFVNLVALQFKEFFREPEIIWWAFIIPIALSWLLGIAIVSGGATSGAVGLVGETAAARESWSPWIDSMERGLIRQTLPQAAVRAMPGQRAAAKRQPLRFLTLGRGEAIRALKEGRISMFIERSADDSDLTYFFDPRSGEAQTTYLVLERVRSGGNEPASGSRVHPLEIQGTRYIDFLVPGLLAMGVMSSALWGIGWALIEIRMKKLMRRMSATPMRKTSFLSSYFATRLIVNGLEFFALFIFAAWYFGVRIQGNPLALFLVFVAGNMAFAGLAIFVSSRTSNPRVGNGLINAITFPMTLLSGVFFSYHHFPSWSIPFVKALPLTMLADSMRSVFNEGAGLAQVALPAVILASIGLALFYCGMKIYKWY